MRMRKYIDTIWLRCGQYLENRGRFAGAEHAYRRMGTGDSPAAAFAMGNVQYRAEKYREAIPHLQCALDNGYRLIETRKRLSVAFERVGRADEASTVIAEADDESSVIRLARLFERQDLTSEAHDTYARAKDDDVEVLEGLLRTLPEDAPTWRRMKIKDRLVRFRAEDPDWLYKHATETEQAREFRKAAGYYDLALAIKPSAWWYYRSGRSWADAGDSIAATERYRRAVSMDVKLDAAKWGVGAFHDEAKRWDLALVAYERDLAEAGEAWRRAGLALRAGLAAEAILDFDSACRHLEFAVSIRPKNITWLLAVGNASELAGRPREALRWYRTAVACAGARQTADLNWRIGRVLYSLDEFDHAATLLRPSEPREQPEAVPTAGAHCMAFSGDRHASSYAPCASLDMRGWHEQGEIRAALGDLEGARQAFRRAALLSVPLKQEVAERYADVLVACGKYRAAVETIFDTQVFRSPVPTATELPARGSYAERLAAYSEWLDQLSMLDDVVLYEANLGLSVDCNPLEICRELLKSHPGEFIHIWSVADDAPLPADLVANPDILVVRKDSLAYTRLLATAKYLVNNSTFPTYYIRRDQQSYLMTWHGTPLKTLGKNMHEPLVHANMARNYLQASAAIFPNQHTRDVLLKGCDVEAAMTGRVEILGYPRNDALVNGVRRRANGDRPIALFAPTWRDDELLSQQLQVVRDVVELLDKHGYDARVRAHHYVEGMAHQIAPEIDLVSRSIPTNDLLPQVDLLVTDYSSIYFDYALTRRPIVFFVSDWDEYSRSRGTYFERDHLPGPVCEDLDELDEALRNPIVDAVARETFNAEFGSSETGNARRRAADLLLSETTEHGGERPFNGVPRILIRQSLIPNGMASSFLNLVHSVQKDARVTVLTDARQVQRHAARQETLSRIPLEVPVLGRIGQQLRTRIEYHVARCESRGKELASHQARQYDDRAFDREAARVLGNASFDAVVEFDGYSGFMARLVLAAARRGSRSAIYLHNDITAEIELRAPELLTVLSTLERFDSVVSVSAGLAEVNVARLGKEFGVRTTRFTSSRNLIQPTVIRTLAEEGIPAEADDFFRRPGTILIHSGRMSPEKNHQFLLEVLAGLPSGDDDWAVSLVLLGDGPLRADVEASAVALGVRERVFFAGRVSNPYAFVSRADMLVLPSLHEGQPMVVLEARILGIPVLASDIEGIRAMGTDGASEILPLDVSTWRKAIIASPDSAIAESFDADAYVSSALEEFWSALGLSSDELITGPETAK